MDGSGQAHLLIMIMMIMMMMMMLKMMMMMMMSIKKDFSNVNDFYEAVPLVIKLSCCRKQIGFLLSKNI